MRWYEELDEKLRDYLPDLPVSAEEPLSKYTSFRIGGPARRMAFPRNAEQLVLLLNFAGECGARPYVLGNGTNVLFPDEGVDRLIINTRDMADIRLLEGGRVRAGAGASLARTAVFACGQGLAGLEFAHGIPGTLGGGVVKIAGPAAPMLHDEARSAGASCIIAGAAATTVFMSFICLNSPMVVRLLCRWGFVRLVHFVCDDIMRRISGRRMSKPYGTARARYATGTHRLESWAVTR